MMTDDVKAEASRMRAILHCGTIKLGCGCKLVGGVWHPERVYHVFIDSCVDHSAGFLKEQSK